MKRILITGKNSYVGCSLKKWLKDSRGNYSVDTISLRDESWKRHDFSNYDVIFHVAGIAHVSRNKKMEYLYYKVNRDLTIEVAKKAKSEGVKQFIFMSSIIVYGSSNKNRIFIDKDTVPRPTDFYGKSKLQAEEKIRTLCDDKFKVAVLRPPMIYGKNSKGNYQRLSSISKKTFLFPEFENSRSMLHIDNLCEFIKSIIDKEIYGLYFPQNSEFVKTSELVKEIAHIHGNNIKMTKIFNPIIKLCINFNIVNKVFGDLAYEKSMSEYSSIKYQIRNFKESIELTEWENYNESDYR